MAGLCSNEHVTDEIHKVVGISPTKLCVHKRKIIVYYKEYNKQLAASEKTVQRRHVKKQVRAHLMGKNEMNNARHKTEKMKPKESVIKPTTIKKSHR